MCSKGLERLFWGGGCVVIPKNRGGRSERG